MGSAQGVIDKWERKIPQNKVKMFSKLLLKKIETIWLTVYKRLLRDTPYMQRHTSNKLGPLYIHVQKKEVEPPTSHHIQNLTQNGS